MASITPTAGHYYILNTNGQGPQTVQITNIVSGNDGNTYYHASIGGGALTWYASNNLPSGFVLVADLGTTAPA